MDEEYTKFNKNNIVLSQGIGKEYRLLLNNPLLLNTNEWLYWLSFCPPSTTTKNFIKILLDSKIHPFVINKETTTALINYVVPSILQVVHSQTEMSLLGFFDLSHDKEYKSWRTYSWDYIYTNGFDKAGRFVLISGVPGSGKTHLGTILMDFTLKQEINVLTNIAFKNPLPKMHVVKTMTDLVIKALEIALKGEKWVAFLDEAGIAFHRQRATTKTAVNWDMLLRLIRKLEGSLVFIEQKEGGFTTTALDFCSTRWIKESLTKRNSVRLKLPSEGINELLIGIPDTPLDFLSSDLSSYFTIDFEITEALDYIKDFNTIPEQRLAWLEFLKKPVNPKKPKK